MVQLCVVCAAGRGFDVCGMVQLCAVWCGAGSGCIYLVVFT